jgi:hypothetical protein
MMGKENDKRSTGLQASVEREGQSNPTHKVGDETKNITAVDQSNLTNVVEVLINPRFMR